MIKRLLVLAALTGCASPTQWKLESIATSIEAFDSKRLLYVDPASPLRFEIVRIGGEIEAFLSLTRHKFSGLESVKITFDVGGVRSVETLPLLAGKMRIRFPKELTESLINALQEGLEVVMIVDGSEQRLDPKQFMKQIKKLEGASPLFQNPFKGLFE